MPKDAAVEEFAGLVRALKARDGRSYEALGRRLSVSASTLHRYCSGATVPEEFAVVERLALPQAVPGHPPRRQQPDRVGHHGRRRLGDDPAALPRQERLLPGLAQQPPADVAGVARRPLQLPGLRGQHPPGPGQPPDREQRRVQLPPRVRHPVLDPCHVPPLLPDTRGRPEDGPPGSLPTTAPLPAPRGSRTHPRAGLLRRDEIAVQPCWAFR
ncbi:helix-turn-helix domain-containing protein [Streptomyces sp. NPDC001919]